MILTAALLLSATAGTAAPVPADAAAAIAKANGDWLRAVTAHDAAAATAPYADDSVLMLADGSTVKGLPAIKAFLADRMAKMGPVAGGGLTSDGASVADDLVYEWGHGSLTVRDSAGRLVEGRPGPYLSVWKRSADGRWQIIRNLGF